jgi:hypothetical protein
VFDINEMLRRAVIRRMNDIDRKKIDVSCEFGEDPCMVRADSDRIEEVVINLLDNALKFTPEGGAIVMESAVADGLALVTVRDSGHFGACSCYSVYAAEKGFLAIAMSNTNKLMCVPGGKGNIIGRVAGQFKTSKDGGDVDAITASTITSRSFLRAVNNAYAEYAKAVTPELDVQTAATGQNNE